MNFFSTLSHRAGVIALLAALASFLCWDAALRVRHIRLLTEIGATDATGAVIQPAGDTRALVFPPAALDTHWWVLHTEQLLATGERVRHTARDDAPDGRPVHWSSALPLSLGALAWLIHCMAHTPTAAAVQSASVLFGPLLLALVLAGFFALTRRRFDTPSAVLFVCALGSSAFFLENFAAGEADHHGLAAALCLLSAWLLASARDQRRYFALSGVSGGAALWVSASTAIPVLSALGLGAYVGARLVRKKRSDRDAELWLIWGQWGAASSLFFYAAEYLPAHFGLRLEVNHPLYALAWWSGSAWLARLLRANDDGFFRNRRDAALAVTQAALLLIPPLLVFSGETHVFSLNDPLLRALHHDYIHEFQSLPSVLSVAGWRHFPFLWLIVFPAAALAWLMRHDVSDSSRRLAMLLIPAFVTIVLATCQVRWLGLASAFVAALLAASFIALRHRAASRAGLPFFLIVCGTLSVGAMLWYPLSIAWSRSPYGTPTQAPDRAELASLVVRDVAWALHGATDPSKAVLLSGPTTSTQLAYFGGFRVLGTLYWENLAGLHAAAAIFGSDENAALDLCLQHGVTHLVLFSWDDFGSAYDHLQQIAAGTAVPATGSTSLARHLSDRRIPRWLRPLAYDIPPSLGLSDQHVQIYEVHANQSPLEACLYLARYQREIGDPNSARRTLARAAALFAAENQPLLESEIVLQLAEEAKLIGEISLAQRFLGSVSR